MGSKKEAVREIMRVLPRWDFDDEGAQDKYKLQLRGVRLDSDGEVIATTAETNEQAGSSTTDHEFMTLGFIREDMGHSKQFPDAEWYVQAPVRRYMARGVIGHVFDRMEYEIFRAAILEEQEDEESLRQDRDDAPDTQAIPRMAER